MNDRGMTIVIWKNMSKQSNLFVKNKKSPRNKYYVRALIDRS